MLGWNWLKKPAELKNWLDGLVLTGKGPINVTGFSLGPEQDRIDLLGIGWVPENMIQSQAWRKLCYQWISYQMMRLLDVYMLTGWTGENGELT